MRDDVIMPIRDEYEPGRPCWVDLATPDPADADATAAAITANGGTVHQLPFDVLDAGRMAVFSGPDGAIAGLWQARQHNGAAFVTEPGGWSWSQLLTRDKEAAVAFYGAVFDWRLSDDPNWGEYLALGEEGGEIAGATQMGDESSADVPPHWQVVFMVDDADGFVERAEQLGPVHSGRSTTWQWVVGSARCLIHKGPRSASCRLPRRSSRPAAPGVW